MHQPVGNGLLGCCKVALPHPVCRGGVLGCCKAALLRPHRRRDAPWHPLLSVLCSLGQEQRGPCRSGERSTRSCCFLPHPRSCFAAPNPPACGMDCNKPAKLGTGTVQSRKPFPPSCCCSSVGQSPHRHCWAVYDVEDEDGRRGLVLHPSSHQQIVSTALP